MLTKHKITEDPPVKLGRYANILLDRWFKRTFGWAPAKRLMQLLLQQLIPERTITELSFGPQEHINPINRSKDIRLDVHCTDTNGNHFIVEVQLSEQSTFYERAVFNSTFVIQEQLPQGSTDWGFSPLYFIGILNFSIHKGSDQVLYRYRLKEVDSGEDMTDRVEYIFLELPNATDPDQDDSSALVQLGFTLKHISEMTEQPEWAKGEFYDLLFKSAEISNFAPKELKEYRKDMTTERDIKNQIAFAERKGEQKGEQRGEARANRMTAKNLKEMGIALEDISKATGLSMEVIKAL